MFFIYSGYKSLVRYDWKYFLLCFRLSFHFLNGIHTIDLNSDEVQFFCFFWLVLLVSYLRRLPNPKSQRFTPMLPPQSLTAFVLMFMSTTHSELIFIFTLLRGW